MKTKITREYSFTPDEVERILTKHVACKIGEPDKENTVKNVSWVITQGDSGIKDPMDYSEYKATEVTEVVVTL